MEKIKFKPLEGMDIFLNKEEQGALWRFLIIYVTSALFLMSIIAILYYNNETNKLHEKRSMEIKTVVMSYEKELMQAEMDKVPYLFHPPKEFFTVALLKEDKQTLFSSFKTPLLDLNTTPYAVHQLATPINGVAYIVVDEDMSEREILRLKFIILFTMVISALFVGVEGYFLSRLLLKPVHLRIEKLNHFIKDSSHELNTPVAALMMSVSNLKQSSFKDVRVINHISISTKLISQIYNSLSYIAFHDIDEVFEESFDLALLIQESVGFFNEIASTKDNIITAQLQTTFVYMDKSRIQKVIHNLLSNAIKYSYPKTAICVELSEHLLTVKNEGIGIHKENQKSIFKRFERRSNAVGGFGIGLDIVNSVCKRYDIKVWVESIPNKETTFFLHFPITHIGVKD